jgi:hypothetical protein
MPKKVDTKEPKKIGVRFKQHYDIYFSGDQAGFTEALAKDLVDRGIADYHDPLVQSEPEEATSKEQESSQEAEGTEEEQSDESEEGERQTEEEFRAELAGKTKAELVAQAKADLGLDLSESSKKEELIDAIVAAVVKKS